MPDPHILVSVASLPSRSTPLKYTWLTRPDGLNSLVSYPNGIVPCHCGKPPPGALKLGHPAAIMRIMSFADSTCQNYHDGRVADAQGPSRPLRPQPRGMEYVLSTSQTSVGPGLSFLGWTVTVLRLYLSRLPLVVTSMVCHPCGLDRSSFRKASLPPPAVSFHVTLDHATAPLYNKLWVGSTSGTYTLPTSSALSSKTDPSSLCRWRGSLLK